ncbi:MAG: hypothetical protein MJ213_05310 [Bacilli bacterium]|nr:hypothetical protein [Bacilli bacterium]
MKKPYLLVLAIPLILFSCKSSGIDMPKSPFDDTYVRIGAKSEYEIANPLNDGEFEEIKESIKNNDPHNVSHFKHQLETRDLKYAYFGRESSTVSQCSMSSQVEDSTRYSNNVSIDINNANQQIQTANAGIIKTSTTVTDYTFDIDFKKDPKDSGYYRQTSVTEHDDISDDPVVIIPKAEFNSVVATFGLKPLERKIKAHFNFEGTFDLLGVNSVCGTTEDGTYLVKEGYSAFSDFSTTMGRSYKAEDNYFYEGLLEKYTEQESGKKAYRFKYFRFYHELLILSKAFDGTGVPVLYLDKPVLIDFSEDKYWIDYNTLQPYTGEVPLPDAPQE